MCDEQKTRVQLVAELKELRRRIAELESSCDECEQYRILAEETNDVPYSIDTNGIITYLGPQIRRYGWA